MKKRDRPWTCQRGSKTRKVSGYSSGQRNAAPRHQVLITGSWDIEGNKLTGIRSISCKPLPVNSILQSTGLVLEPRLGKRWMEEVMVKGQLLREKRRVGRRESGGEWCGDSDRYARVGALKLERESVFLPAILPPPPQIINSLGLREVKCDKKR